MRDVALGRPAARVLRSRLCYQVIAVRIVIERSRRLARTASDCGSVNDTLLLLVEVFMRLGIIAAVGLPFIGLCAGMAMAADPKPHADITAGAEVMELGSFDCLADNAGGKANWDCPAQTFDSKFREAPVVYFSVAGMTRVTIGDQGFNVAIATKDQATKEGFIPKVDTTLVPAAGGEKATISVNWIAVGPGERVRNREKRERKAK